MNILFILPHVKVVGGVRRVMEMSNRLMDAGHSVSIANPGGAKCKWMDCKARFVDINQAKKERFDVSTFSLSDQYKECIATNARLKIYWVLAAEALYKDKRVPLEALSRNEYTFFANSTFTSKYITDRKRLRYKPPIIPGGINPDHFKYVPETPKEFDVLYYGSKRPWKGGKIIESALLGRPVKILKMDGLGTPQDQMYTLYNRCTVFVSASQCEGFGFTVLEAMKCGCPVVCTDDGGNRDFVKHRYNALLTTRTPSAIYANTMNLVNNIVLRKSLIGNGLITANDKKYNWDNVTKSFIDNIKLFSRPVQ